MQRTPIELPRPRCSDFRVKICVAHLHAPDARPCSQVQDSLAFGISERREAEFATACSHVHLVTDIHAILLGLIVGEDIGALAKGMIAAAVSEGKFNTLEVRDAV